MIFPSRKRSNVGIVESCRWLVLGYLVMGMGVERVWGKITLDSVREITEATREGRERVGWGEGGGGGGGGVGSGKGVEMRMGMGIYGEEGGGEGVGEGKGGQVIMGTGSAGGDRDEIENTVTAALHMLCSDLLVELEKPLLAFSSSSYSSSPFVSFGNTQILADRTKGEVNCTQVKTDFDDLLRETTWFLYQVQERQMVWRWARGSAVQEGVVWLQGLWASRRSNSQDRSFIEQQLELYKGTECFEKVNDEVLRKDIEVVEYLNDLIEMFP
ncbi:uncharacterized protein EAE97_005838 [Botrytis byssoidea]|uniref:Uncharacterized protein n=1 Tax=Botrytis byssoidea TaxID=139641 RepID=A0A9P5IJJ4_9HELO|nr:uncharacterized protein EAE97_005838 [Botrytis byssoidea]KAF7943768.1 hypothetical protein EAE97_005838 [Botrytis byssoidea]